jgi:hypothetical protein
MNARRIHRTDLFGIGWALFWLSFVLPMSASTGAQPHRGFTHVFFAFLSVYLIVTQLDWSNREEILELFGMSFFAFAYLLMFVAPSFLWLKNRKAKWAQWGMICAACYASFVGVFLIPKLLYGYYVWCLSFVVVAAALSKKYEEGQVVLSSG